MGLPRAVRRWGAALRAVLLVVPAAVWAAPAHEHPQPQVLAPGYSALEFEAPVPGSYRLPPLGEAADGVVVDTQGRARALHALLDDKISVLAFIYTRCNDVNGCPLASFVLKQIQDRVRAAPDLAGQVRLLSMSFDPAYDTPTQLAAYAGYFRAADFDWRFLTARNEAELESILQAYNQWVIKDVDAEGRALGTISHLLRVYLIDRAKRIRNIYSVSFLHADTVLADIRTLQLELIDE